MFTHSMPKQLRNDCNGRGKHKECLQLTRYILCDNGRIHVGIKKGVVFDRFLED
jgi:hypothetical protein